MKAAQEARMCRIGSGIDPCPYLVPSKLSCGCQMWAGDKTELDKIKAEWTAAGCKPADLCPAIACPNPGTQAFCLPIDSGDWCTGGGAATPFN
jgi:hypothetical protein